MLASSMVAVCGSRLLLLLGTVVLTGLNPWPADPMDAAEEATDTTEAEQDASATTLALLEAAAGFLPEKFPSMFVSHSDSAK
mmetsp:Transcript_22548/g.53169  ORF Transcript_22548/g.53169 Transcript_22548/m.53169 type:complete len:82 (-) Transcript_22548:140-385(-)